MLVYRYLEQNASPGLVETSSFRIEPPPGEGWECRFDWGADLVEFKNRSRPGVEVLVLRNAISPDFEPASADEVAAEYRAVEARSRTMLRVVPSGHDFEVAEEGWRDVEGRRFHLTVFHQVFDGEGEADVVLRDGLLCLHFPDGFPASPSFYCFVFTQARLHEFVPPTLGEKHVLSILRSFRLKAEGQPRGERRRTP